MKIPRVSVLIPTYNYARYLTEALESVLSQNFRDFEIIIADDGSTDDSASVIRQFADQDARIHFHRHPSNIGMVSNWNWCLKEARGEYIKYLFGDDCLKSLDALGKFVAMLDEHPSAALAASARYIPDEQSRIVEVWNHLSSGLHNGKQVIIQCLPDMRNLIGEPTAVMFRRVAAIRGFDPAYRQLVDLEMWFHFLESWDLIYTTDPLCCFRRHDRQQTAVNRREQIVQQEVVRLFDTYLSQPWLQDREMSRQWLFDVAYRIRKTYSREFEMEDTLKRLMERIGTGWYAGYWLRRKIVQPFLNLQRSLDKRIPVLRSVAHRLDGKTDGGGR